MRPSEGTLREQHLRVHHLCLDLLGSNLSQVPREMAHRETMVQGMVMKDTVIRGCQAQCH